MEARSIYIPVIRSCKLATPPSTATDQSHRGTSLPIWHPHHEYDGRSRVRSGLPHGSRTRWLASTLQQSCSPPHQPCTDDDHDGFRSKRWRQLGMQRTNLQDQSCGEPRPCEDPALVKSCHTAVGVLGRSKLVACTGATSCPIRDSGPTRFLRPSAHGALDVNEGGRKISCEWVSLEALGCQPRQWLASSHGSSVSRQHVSDRSWDHQPGRLGSGAPPFPA